MHDHQDTGAGPAGRPLDIGQVLNEAFLAYRRNARRLLATSALLVVPVQVLLFAGFAATVEDPDALYSLTSDPAPAGGEQLVVGAAGVLLSALVTIAVVAACLPIVATPPGEAAPTASSALRFARHRAGALVWLVVLEGMLLVVAALALVVPAIWLSVA